MELAQQFSAGIFCSQKIGDHYGQTCTGDGLGQMQERWVDNGSSSRLSVCQQLENLIRVMPGA